ncbi:cell adhesion molecule Dscam1-like isoform X1 [Dermacentor andersoni]|uniref:cell adhesion molecule Dscam1-like isoform X1 n=1 Tax=Dermacentor andersoni TaxID=34620 RepID=UPI002416ACC1|nr:cell adhesion molecule DSCAML1-like isoform X1 [Dermacentor andersoni]
MTYTVYDTPAEERTRETAATKVKTREDRHESCRVKATGGGSATSAGTLFAVGALLLAAAPCLSLAAGLESPEVHVLIPSNLRRGDTAEIFCSLRRGSLPVAFQWLHNGRPIRPDTVGAAEPSGTSLGSNSAEALWKVDHRERRSELLIENIGARQIGNYTCIASNAAGKTSFTASLLVEVPPTWLHMPGDRAAVVGSSLTIDCAALGHPTPVTKWTRSQYPSETVLGNKDDHISVLANGSLTISSVRSSDSGLYRCDVENGVGTLITKTINLTVSVPPLIRKLHEIIKVRLGSIVTLHCGASGEEPLQIAWVKDDKSIEKSLRERYDVIDRSFPGGIASDLLIHKSTLGDTGEFACYVTNRFGTATAMRSLFVLELPSPPIGVRVDDIGKRSARVSWKKPFAEVTHFLLRYWRENGRGRKLSSATVPGTETSAYLQDLQPGSEYSGHIVSQNDVGLSGPSVAVHFVTSEEAPSAPPTDVHSTPIGEKELMVMWKGPPAEHRNGKIQGYYVGYKAYDSNLPYSYQTVTGGAESAVLKDLKPSTAYSIIVQAFNRAGQSPSSHQIAVHPFTAGMPGPPSFFTGDVTCCSVLLTVTSKQKPTEGVTQYLVMYKNSEGSWRSVYFPPHARKMLLRGLQRDTHYEVRLAAYNLEGRGQLSAPASFTTLRSGSWDEEETVEAAEVPFYLRAQVLVPVAVSVGIIVISVVAALAYYRRMLGGHGSHVKYESCVQSRESGHWQDVRGSRASYARRSVAESTVYDTPWDAQAALAAANQTVSVSLCVSSTKSVPPELTWKLLAPSSIQRLHRTMSNYHPFLVPSRFRFFFLIMRTTYILYEQNT